MVGMGTDVVGKVGEARRPRGAGGKRRRRWLRRCEDVANCLPLGATNNSYVTERGGEASRPGGGNGAWQQHQFRGEK
jgi:hypothetical protein